MQNEQPVEIEEKAVWTSTADLPDSCFLFVEPGEKDEEGKTTPRSLRHLPYKDANGKIDLPHLRNAIARANQIRLKDGSLISAAQAEEIRAKARRLLELHKDFNSWCTSFDEWDEARRVEEIKAGIAELNQAMVVMVNNILWDNIVDDKAEALKALADGYAERVKSLSRQPTLLDKVKEFLGLPEPDFTVYKDSTGQWRFEGVYSSSARDRDMDVITPEAHKSFVAMVECGAVPYPVLLPWHIKSLPMGQVDRVAYDEAQHKARVSGYWFPEFYSCAEKMSAMKDLGMSHGMPYYLIDRRPDDPTHIDRYVSAEVSVLPRLAAANLETSFVVKEETMALRDEQVEFLKNIGLPEEYINRLQTKEATETAPLAEKQATEQPTEMVEVLKEMAEVIGSLGQAVKAVTERLDALEKAEDERLKAIVDNTPKLSLKEMIAKSVVGSDEALVDGRNSLAKSGPKEAAAPGRTGIPIVDALIEGKDWRTVVEVNNG